MATQMLQVWVALDRHADGVSLSPCIGNTPYLYHVASTLETRLPQVLCAWTEERIPEWHRATLVFEGVGVPIRSDPASTPELTVIGGRAIEDE